MHFSGIFAIHEIIAVLSGGKESYPCWDVVQYPTSETVCFSWFSLFQIK